MSRPTTAAVRLLPGTKEPVRVATTANVDLATGGLLTVDGITLEAGDRVLVKDQTDDTQNGIYVASAGEWYRSGDATDPRAVTMGVNVTVQEGTVNAGSVFEFKTRNPDIGSDAITVGVWAEAVTSAVLTVTDLLNQAENEAGAAADSAIAADADRIAAQTARTQAQTARDSAWQAQTEASAAATAAETARDTALTANSIYADTTAGLAASSEGDYFFTVPAAPGDPFNLYREVGGAAVLQSTYPSGAQLQGAVDDINALLTLFPRDEYTAFVNNDENTTIVAIGGYPLSRSATDDRTLTHAYVEIINGVAESEVEIIFRVNEIVVHGPIDVVQGTPHDEAVDIDIAVGDEVRVEIVSVTGSVYAVWAQLDGDIA